MKVILRYYSFAAAGAMIGSGLALQAGGPPWLWRFSLCFGSIVLVLAVIDNIKKG